MSGSQFGAPDSTFDVDRLVGWMVAISAALLTLPAAAPALDLWHEFALWWHIPAVGAVAGVYLLAIFGWVLPRPVLTALWWSLPVANTALLLLAFAAYRGSDFGGGGDLGRVGPWFWWFEVGFSCFPPLLVRPAAAIAWCVLSAIAPAISSFVFAGVLEPGMVGASILHIGNVVFVVVVIATRHQLLALASAEHDSLVARSAGLRAATQRRRMEALTRTVHDDVLATLVAALRADGPPTPALRNQAKLALDVLQRRDDPMKLPEDERMPSDLALEHLIEAVLAASDGIEVTGAVSGGSLPAAAVRTVALAAGEAARNAVRHAGAEAKVSCELVAGSRGIELAVHDDGPGFSMERVPEDRLGITSSVLGRMEALPGGSASIRHDDTGTTVELTWRP